MTGFVKYLRLTHEGKLSCCQLCQAVHPANFRHRQPSFQKAGMGNIAKWAKTDEMMPYKVSDGEPQSGIDR
jgi:hypothetical protein